MTVVVLTVLGGLLGSIGWNAAVYASAAHHRRRHPPVCADDEEGGRLARGLASLRMFVRECAATALWFASMPLGIHRERLRFRDRGHGRPVVLLVSAGGSFPALVLARRLRAAGRDVHRVRHGVLARHVDRDVERLGAAVERLSATSRHALVDVIAHGTGGLVARAYARARGRSSRIGCLVTLGTPHQGTVAVRGRFVDPALHVRPGSALLCRLADDEPVPGLLECISIYSADDALVVPARAAYWPGACNIEIRGVGHLSLLLSSRVLELVCENVAERVEPDRGLVPS